MTEINEQLLCGWIGRKQSVKDVIRPEPIKLLAATLDRKDIPMDQGAVISPTWLWLFFLEGAVMSELGPDGHAERGGFLPPVPLPRRMWAGCKLLCHEPIKIGCQVERTSIIKNVSIKQGRSGTLVFVIVEHCYYSNDNLCITEEQDIVFREMPRTTEVSKHINLDADNLIHKKSQWSRTIHPDPVLLFRYSALTFNSHRIHYDRAYCLENEGYPGLVVHGPLTMTLLLDLLHRNHPEALIKEVNCRAISPLFDTALYTVHGCVDVDNSTLWAIGPNGEMAMHAIVILS